VTTGHQVILEIGAFEDAYRPGFAVQLGCIENDQVGGFGYRTGKRKTLGAAVEEFGVGKIVPAPSSASNVFPTPSTRVFILTGSGF
jgi:hypothetical protein